MPAEPASDGIRDTAAVALSASSVQVGAAIGATAFPLAGPVGVAAMRQAVAAVALLLVVRPRLRGVGFRALAPALGLGATLVVMNVSLYAAVQRTGLALAVTVEFLGPLAVALLAGRRPRDAGLGVLALGGVALLTLSGESGGTAAEPLGVLLALLAAAAWAGYILLGARVGRRLPGASGAAIASLTASVITLPVLIGLLVALPPEHLVRVLAVGLATGLLSNAIPYSIDLAVLRRMPRALFGMLQSLHPVAAALFGLIVLGQLLDLVQVVGVAAVCIANVVAIGVTRSRPRRRRKRRGPVG